MQKPILVQHFALFCVASHTLFAPHKQEENIPIFQMKKNLAQFGEEYCLLKSQK